MGSTPREPELSEQGPVVAIFQRGTGVVNAPDGQVLVFAGQVRQEPQAAEREGMIGLEIQWDGEKASAWLWFSGG